MRRNYLPVLGLAVGLLCPPAAFSADLWHEENTRMAFVPIPKGCYVMGIKSHVTPWWSALLDKIGHQEKTSKDEVPRHEVCLDAFYLGQHEVTLGEWYAVIGGGESDRRDRKLPVTLVSWQQADEFARQLTARNGGKYRFRLPTEAEWEYACRSTSREDGEIPEGELRQMAWFEFKVNTPQPVGGKKPNALGLYDMVGNVWEWTADHYAADAYAKHTLYNPRFEKSGTPRSLRGASFRSEQTQTRCTKRAHLGEAERMSSVGLRLVRE